MQQPATGAAWITSCFSMCYMLTLKMQPISAAKVFVCLQCWRLRESCGNQTEQEQGPEGDGKMQSLKELKIHWWKRLLVQVYSLSMVPAFLWLSVVNLSCLRVAKRDSVAFHIKQSSPFKVNYNTVIFIMWQQRPSYYKLHLLVELFKKQAHGKENWKRAMKSKLFLVW